MRRRREWWSAPEVWRALARLIGDTIRSWLPGRTVERSEAGIPTDPDHRREQLARLGSSAWLRMRMASSRANRADDAQRRAILEDAVVRTARDAYAVVGNMKGAMMKLAQFVSFDPGVPESVREELKGLQAAAPSMDADVVAGVVLHELGAPPDEVFAAFDGEPIASASIGQVHRAHTREGRDVAVKVQYPGVDDAIRADLRNAGSVIDTMVAGLADGTDLRPHLEEVTARVSEELDYRLEASNQRWFADRYRGHLLVRIPEPVDELSSARVLTTEFVEGRGFYDVLGDTPELRRRFGEIIFRFAFTSVFRDGIFSGDPHPGNYLFCDDGRVCFLDFGLVKRLDDTERTSLRAPMEAMVTGDREGLRTALRSLGVLPAGVAVDLDLLWDLFVLLLGPVHEDRSVACSLEQASDDRRERRQARRHLAEQLELPPAVIFFQRYRRGTWSVLSHLGAEANWHRIMREILFDEPSSTEIGRRWASVVVPDGHR